MADITRWTIRNIERDTIDIIAEVHEISGMSYGELLNEAVLSWYQLLPEIYEEKLVSRNRGKNDHSKIINHDYHLKSQIKGETTMYLNLITGQIESSRKADDIVCPNMNENSDFSLTKMIDEIWAIHWRTAWIQMMTRWRIGFSCA